MAATVKLTVDLSGWYAKSTRIKAVLRALPAIEIRPKDEANRNKARASFDREDVTYPLSDEGKKQAGGIIATGLKTIVQGQVNASGHTGATAMMRETGKVILEDVRAGILAGRVEGPARSPGWIATKGQNLNMVGLTGDFARSLESRVVGKRGGRRGRKVAA